MALTPQDANLIKTGIEAATSEALRPFADLITKLLGPAAEEIGLGFQAGFSFWKIKQQIRFWQKTQRIIREAGFDPAPVSPRLLQPIIQQASIEEDDDLQDKWAQLLANAANPETQSSILPAFPEMLKQLSPVEAKLLDRMHDEIDEAKKKENLVLLGCEFHGIVQTYREITAGDWRYHSSGLEPMVAEETKCRVLLGNLERLRLVKVVAQRVPERLTPPHPIEPEPDFYRFTALGEAFIQACRKPLPEAASDQNKKKAPSLWS